MGEEVEIQKSSRDVTCIHCGSPTTYFQRQYTDGELDDTVPPVIGCSRCKAVAEDPILQVIAEHLQQSLELEDGPITSYAWKGTVLDGRIYLRGDIDLELLAEDVAAIAAWLFSVHPEWLAELDKALTTRKEA